MSTEELWFPENASWLIKKPMVGYLYNANGESVPEWTECEEIWESVYTDARHAGADFDTLSQKTTTISFLRNSQPGSEKLEYLDYICECCNSFSYNVWGCLGGCGTRLGKSCSISRRCDDCARKYEDEHLKEEGMPE